MSQLLNIEYLRKQAKSLLKECRAGQSDALQRLRARLPRLASLDDRQLTADVQLADIHQALARENGYSNWAELKRHDAPLARFLVAVRGGNLKTAQQEFQNFPTAAEESIHAACAIGNALLASHHLDNDPALLKAEQDGWQPLLYACASPFHAAGERHAAGLVECINLLLDRGADPQAGSALQRAMLSGNRAAAVALYQRGSRPEKSAASHDVSLKQAFWGIPQDSRALDNALAELFADSGAVEEMRRWTAKIGGRQGVWPHQRSPESMSPRDFYRPAFPGNQAYNVMIWEQLIRRGVQPNWHDTTQDSPLHHLAEWDGPAETAEFFVSHGGDPNLKRSDGKTPYFLAVRSGNAAVAEVLRTHGAKLENARLADDLIGACRCGDAKAASLVVRTSPGVLKTLTPEDYDVMVESAAHNRLDIVKLMLEIGFPPGAFGESGATPLHTAAWHGYVEMVQLLLGFGASKAARDTMFGNTPSEWAVHGSKHCRDAEEDYATVVKILA